MTKYRNRPKEGVVPHGAADGVEIKGYDRNERNEEYGAAPHAEIKDCKEHGEKANDGA